MTSTTLSLFLILASERNVAASMASIATKIVTGALSPLILERLIEAR
jgi:hypothetical protein